MTSRTEQPLNGHFQENLMYCEEKILHFLTSRQLQLFSYHKQPKKWLNAPTDTYYYISQMILVAPSLPTTLVETVLQSVMSVYLSVSTFAFEPTDLWS